MKNIQHLNDADMKLLSGFEFVPNKGMAQIFVSNRKDITCASLFEEFKLWNYEGETFYVNSASLSGNVVIFDR